jgi:hypothetical protein
MGRRAGGPNRSRGAWPGGFGVFHRWAGQESKRHTAGPTQKIKATKGATGARACGGRPRPGSARERAPSAVAGGSHGRRGGGQRRLAPRPRGPLARGRCAWRLPGGLGGGGARRSRARGRLTRGRAAAAGRSPGADTGCAWQGVGPVARKCWADKGARGDETGGRAAGGPPRALSAPHAARRARRAQRARAGAVGRVYECARGWVDAGSAAQNRWTAGPGANSRRCRHARRCGECGFPPFKAAAGMLRRRV